jgi:hypothetical protein
MRRNTTALTVPVFDSARISVKSKSHVRIMRDSRKVLVKMAPCCRQSCYSGIGVAKKARELLHRA